MKARRSLLTLVAVFFVALACAFGVLNFKSKASAAEYDVPTATAVAEEGFELTEASIRLTDGKAAIRFSATVTEDYADAEFVATITYNGKTLAAPFGAAPEFVEGVATLNAYLNFGNASEEVLAQAITAEFTPAVYAKTADACIQAKGSETAARSMRVVANDAYLNWEEGVGYEKEDVAELGYFTNATRSDKEFAVVDTEKTLYVHIPGAPANAAEIYVDDVKVAATYDETTDKYTVANFATAGKYITIFAEDGKAYSSNIATGATAISNLEELKAIIGVAANLEGYYVLTSDIEVGTWTYVENKLFGTFNGLGYKLTNYINSAHTSHSGLFRWAYGAEFKNVIMASGKEGLTNNAGVLVGQVGPDVAADPEKGIEAVTYEDTVFDNVIAFMPVGGHNSGIISVQQHAMSAKDSIFVTGSTTKHTASYGGSIVYNNNTPLNCENVIVVHYEPIPLANAPAQVKNATVFNSMGALYNADKENDIVSDYQWSVLTSINAFLPISKENIDDLKSTALVSTNATFGIHVLMEDIDMHEMSVTNNAYTWDNKVFAGVIDGNGYTLSRARANYGTASGTGAYITPYMALTAYNIGLNLPNAATNHTGIFGRINSGTLYIDECALKVDSARSSGTSLLGFAPQKTLTIRDSFLYHGNGFIGGDGWLLGATAASSGCGLTMSNTYAINLSGKADLTKGAITYSAATAGTDYFYYTDPADFLKDENVNLPEGVVALYKKIGAVQELCLETLDQARTASGGYWYLTKDLDLTKAARTTALFQHSGKDVGAHYSGVNLYLDGQGHAITGFTAPGSNQGVIVCEAMGTVTFKNLKLVGKLNGGATTQLFTGLVRENSAQNIINVENVFVDLEAHSNGSLFQSWTPFSPVININGLFVNDANATGGFVFTGIHWKGTINCTDVFVIAPETLPLAHADAISAIVFKDGNGNTIVPGGDGENDFACTIASSLDALKALNDGDDWSYAQGIFADLDAEFFA